MLKNLIHSLMDSAKEDFGVPVRIRRLAESGALYVAINEQKQSVKSGDVTKWHEWDGHNLDISWRRRGAFVGWKKSGGEYLSFEMQVSEMGNLGNCHISGGWSCDIQDVVGLACSKSALEDFDSLDEMVTTNSQRMIDSVSKEKLKENLAWREIRIIHNSETSDHFARYLWDGRLFLINSGGSHHFAAARYVASRIGVPVPLTGALHTYSMNPSTVDSLKQGYDIYAITDEAGASNAFHDAMKSFGATYLSCSMPRPFDNAKAVFLPRNNRRSIVVSNIFRDVGLFEVTKHLSELVSKQNSLRPEPI